MPDEIVDRFCVLGTVDDHLAKLRELEALGVDQFNVYLMHDAHGGDARRLRRARDPRAARALTRRVRRSDSRRCSDGAGERCAR